jgi:hypothetical protein
MMFIGETVQLKNDGKPGPVPPPPAPTVIVAVAVA